jgi:hypothetical protein
MRHNCQIWRMQISSSEGCNFIFYVHMKEKVNNFLMLGTTIMFYKCNQWSKRLNLDEIGVMKL